MNFDHIPAGKELPNDVYVAIEIPANHTPIKYEIDKDMGALLVDRFMATPMFYPANYGFIPHTLADDGDPSTPSWSRHSRFSPAASFVHARSAFST